MILSEALFLSSANTISNLWKDYGREGMGEGGHRGKGREEKGEGG
jgi:hypothetical protein